MATTRNKDERQVYRLRRDSADDEGKVVSYTEEGSGQPIAFHGSSDEGPRVAPVGDRPVKSEEGEIFNNITLTSTYQNSELIEVRAWRTIVFGLDYTTSIGGGARLIFKLQGTYDTDDIFLYNGTVIDPTLNTFAGTGAGVRVIQPAEFASPLATSIRQTISFNIDEYDYVLLSVREISPQGVFGSVSVTYRTVR